MARDKVKRNVVPLASVPQGGDGRPSKSMTQTSLLTGARTEDLRALRWEHVHLDAI